jgi:hypothetical protein
MHTSPNKSSRKQSRNLSKKNAKKRLRKSPKRTNRNNTSKPWATTPNHLYITKRFIQGLACRPIIQPSHKISPWSSQASPISHMTWEHIFQAIYISFSDSYLVREMSLRQEWTYAPPQDKSWGLNIHDGKWAFGPIWSKEVIQPQIKHSQTT